MMELKINRGGLHNVLQHARVQQWYIACIVLVGHAILREGNGFIILYIEENVPAKCTKVTVSMIKYFVHTHVCRIVR